MVLPAPRNWPVWPERVTLSKDKELYMSSHEIHDEVLFRRREFLAPQSLMAIEGEVTKSTFSMHEEPITAVYVDVTIAVYGDFVSLNFSVGDDSERSKALAQIDVVMGIFAEVRDTLCKANLNYAPIPEEKE